MFAHVSPGASTNSPLLIVGHFPVRHRCASAQARIFSSVSGGRSRTLRTPLSSARSLASDDPPRGPKREVHDGGPRQPYSNSRPGHRESGRTGPSATFPFVSCDCPPKPEWSRCRTQDGLADRAETLGCGPCRVDQVERYAYDRQCLGEVGDPRRAGGGLRARPLQGTFF
jgi:hypothetical protein